LRLRNAAPHQARGPPPYPPSQKKQKPDALLPAPQSLRGQQEASSERWLHRCVGPEQVGQIDLCPAVDHTGERNGVGDPRSRRQEVGPPLVYNTLGSPGQLPGPDDAKRAQLTARAEAVEDGLLRIRLISYRGAATAAGIAVYDVKWKAMPSLLLRCANGEPRCASSITLHGRTTSRIMGTGRAAAGRLTFLPLARARP
jgi:hypothetical protein